MAKRGEIRRLFYRWFERVFPANTYLIDNERHSRADMRKAYLAGYQRGRKEASK